MKKSLACLLCLTMLLLSSCIASPAKTPGTETGTGTTAESPGAFSIEPGQGIVDTSKREYSYRDLSCDLAELAEAYPAHFSYREFGKTAAGRSLYVGILGDPDARRQIVVSAAIHGREYLTALLVMKQLERCLALYDTASYDGVPYSTLFGECCFYIVPMTNPDGVMLSEEGISSVSDETLRNRLWEIYYRDYGVLTHQDTINGYLQYWKANVEGTDLNRNFDARWEEYHNYSQPSFAQYKGPSPASAPETRALTELVESLSRVDAVLCIHSQGEVIYWNCGQGEELAYDTLEFSRALAERNGYEVVMEQNNDASFSDWCALKKGLIAVTVETGVGICPLDLDKFPKMWEDNYDLFAIAAKYFR